MGQNGGASYHAVLPIALLHTGRTDGVDGATRFQKLVFLGQEEESFPDHYEYRPDRFGPYSPGLDTDLRWAMAKGYVDRNVQRNTAGHEKHVYTLTPAGIQYARELLADNRIRPLFETAEAINREWADESIDDLLRYVYRKYEEYTTQTELDRDRLMDPDTESQFLEPAEDEDDDADFLGVAPERVTEVNSSFEDLNPST